MNPGNILFFCIGGFSLFFAMSDYDFYWNSRKAAFWVSIIGKPAARAIYVIFSLGIMVAAIVIPFD